MEKLIPVTSEISVNNNEVAFGSNKPMTVAFLGDSITQGYGYIKWVEHYYNIKYPEKAIKFINKGISGENAANIVSRFDWDVLNNDLTAKPDEATLMIGMNDVNRALYPDGTDEDKEAALNYCYRNIENIINLCKDNDIQLTLITPSFYDEASGAEPETVAAGVNYALGKVAEKMKSLAETYGLEVIDLYTFTTNANNMVRMANAETGNLFTDDRVHPNELGSLLYGYGIIKGQFDVSDLETGVSISVNGSVVTKRAKVKDISINDTGISFSYTPAGLPMYVNDNYNVLKGYGIAVDEINQEIIKIAGLENGNYTIEMDGTVIGTYTAEELENGVNIAENANNPGQALAAALYAKTEIKNNQERDLRIAAYVEKMMRSEGVETTDNEVVSAWLDEKLNSSSTTANQLSYLTPYKNRIFGKKVSIWQIINENELLSETAPYANTYSVSVKKAD